MKKLLVFLGVMVSIFFAGQNFSTMGNTPTQVNQANAADGGWEYCYVSANPRGSMDGDTIKSVAITINYISENGIRTEYVKAAIDTGDMSTGAKKATAIAVARLASKGWEMTIIGPNVFDSSDEKVIFFRRHLG
ncbi:MAG: hypothetical protein ABI878_07160 [Acidobacteriota bacterium]